MEKKSNWLALVIGNSRFHWAYFQEEELQQSWDSSEAIIPSDWENLPLIIASVVPAKIDYLSTHQYQKIIQLEDIPIQGIYPTMGIDRALALLGAIHVWGCPCVVIDGGTALTLTGVNENRELVGGAILPGLRLQFNSLATSTAALPFVNLSPKLPPIWAKTTTEAIESGILYTLLAGIHQFLDNWWKQFPNTPAIFTGGDGKIIKDYLSQTQPEIAHQLKVDSNLIFWGMSKIEDCRLF